MFGNAGYANAKARYRDIDISSKVEGASPHRLIAVLYEELMKTLETIAAGLSAGSSATRPGMPERRARSLSILMGLESSLDHSQGGELAGGLASIYREARRLIGDGMRQQDPKRIIQARDMIGEIAEAWVSIG